MKRQIIDLWNGSIVPIEEPPYDRDREMRLYAVIEENIAKLTEMLGEDGAKLLDAVNDSHNELQAMMREECFVRGFSLGARLVAEACTEG